MLDFHAGISFLDRAGGTAGRRPAAGARRQRKCRSACRHRLGARQRRLRAFPEGIQVQRFPACLRGKAVDADLVGGAAADAGGRQVQSRHADGQPGLFARLDWDLWLGGSAARPSRRAMPNIAPSWPTATRAAAAPDRRTTSASTCALQMARILRFRQQPDRRLGRAHPGSAELGAATGARAPGQRGNVSRKTRCRRSRSPTTWPSGMSSGRVPGCRR